MRKPSSFRKSLALGVVALGLAGVAGASNLPTPGTTEDKVRHELVMLPYYGVFDNLSYRVDGNTVTLLGQVTKPWLKNEAEKAVKHVEGVSRVDNQVEVLPLSTFDDKIRRQTYFAIYGYGPLERYGWGTQPSIRILVKNGNVTLAGLVGNETDKNLAFIRANGVAGVFSVKNELTVER